MGEQSVRVGVGAYIFDEQGRLLLGLRKGEHASGVWCTPGGHLEFGETPSECAARETLEETGLDVFDIEPMCFTNDFFDEGAKHYITLHMSAKLRGGELQVMEPHKFASWQWFGFDDLPEQLITGICQLKASGVLSEMFERNA